MNSFFWRTGENIVHHIRAESVAEVRDRIAAIHGDEIARRAIITLPHPIQTLPSEPAAA
jgi:hypothetical protein